MTAPGSRPMTTDADGQVIWDHELEQLSQAVIVILGEGEVTAAVARTFIQLKLERRGAVSFAEYKRILKSELQRLLRPQ